MAKGTQPDEVFAAVTEEIGRILLAPRTGGFWKLLLLGLGQAAEQLPRLGFELTDEREVTLGVPV